MPKITKIKFISGPNDNASKGSGAQAQAQMQKGYSFDSSALERAADAARQLERSRNAKEAFEMARLQEFTKQREFEAATKVYSKKVYEENDVFRNLNFGKIS